MSNPASCDGLRERLQRVKAGYTAALGALRGAIIGQDDAMRQLLTAVFAGGHCMIEGPLATGKTLLADSVARVMDLAFKRIQFTPDLMPADISGTEILEEDRSTGHRFAKFVKGPVFCNILMADEINRTPPKTQAALLEVMQERQVTLGGTTYPLPEPFFVLATQISMEQDGTYPLPEAQQDRFMFSIRMNYLDEDSEFSVVRRSTGADAVELDKVLSGDDLLLFARTIREVALPPEVATYIVDLVDSSRPTQAGAPEAITEYVVWGAGLRASQFISLAAKSLAAIDGRDTVTPADIKHCIHPVLRHRIGLSFRADVDRVTVDDVIERLVAAVPMR